MAEETIDAAIKRCNLEPERPCVTAGLLLEGAHDWSPLLYISLVQDYGIETEVSTLLVIYFLPLHHLQAMILLIVDFVCKQTFFCIVSYRQLEKILTAKQFLSV